MAPGGGQNIIQMSLLQSIYFLEKHDKLSESVTFVKLFYTPERTKRRTTWKWMLSTFKYKQLDRKKSTWKRGHLSTSHLVICFLPELWSLNCLKKWIFCNFVLTSARNLSLLKQFTYIHLKVIVTHFQKMGSFIMLWLTVLDIQVFEAKEVS